MQQSRKYNYTLSPWFKHSYLANQDSLVRLFTIKSIIQVD